MVLLHLSLVVVIPAAEVLVDETRPRRRRSDVDAVEAAAQDRLHALAGRRADLERAAACFVGSRRLGHLQVAQQAEARSVAQLRVRARREDLSDHLADALADRLAPGDARARSARPAAASSPAERSPRSASVALVELLQRAGYSSPIASPSSAIRRAIGAVRKHLPRATVVDTGGAPVVVSTYPTMLGAIEKATPSPAGELGGDRRRRRGRSRGVWGRPPGLPRGGRRSCTSSNRARSNDESARGCA
jgi:hypothetical protein